MFGASRGTVLRGIVAILLLIVLVASCIVFVSRQDARQAAHAIGHTLASATATATTGASVQFTPSPGITVTVAATPAHGGSSSSSSSKTSSKRALGSGAPTIPPRYPTPVPTTSAPTGGGGEPPTPTASVVSSAPSTPTATPVPRDDAELLSQSPTALDAATYEWTTVSVTMLNTGTTTWNSTTGGYTLKCYQTCWSGWYSPNSVFSVPPGMSHTFTGYMLPSPSSFYYVVDKSIWQLWNPATGFFGQQAVITVVNHGWIPSFSEAIPACENDGAVWAQQGSSGTISCGANSLALAQGGSSGAIDALVSSPVGYDYGNYLVKFHIHFDTTSGTTFAGVVLSIPSSASGGKQTVFMVSPAGYYCEAELLRYCAPNGGVFPLPASSDYDFFVEVSSNGGAFNATANGVGLEGGLEGGGATGLIETTAADSTDAAYFSDYQMYEYKS